MKKLYVIILSVSFCISLYAQDQSITVIGSGDGANKTTATNQALRNCIEKSMGAFLSSSTVVSNDELVKDEIVTIASGNIVSYEILSEVNTKDNCNVSVSAVISPEKLITTLKAKGYNFELNGGVYAQNILKEKFYAEQEKVALQIFLTIWEKVQLFEFDIKITEPKTIKTYQIGNSNYYQVNQNVLAELKESLGNSIKTTLTSYGDNAIYFINGFSPDNNCYMNHTGDRDSQGGNINLANQRFGITNISNNVAYSMCALFTPKLNATYISFTKSLINLLNSISIKDIESYKNLNPKYLEVNISTKCIDAKKNGLDFTPFPKDQFGNVVFYLRNPDNKELLAKLSEFIKVKSTASNFTSDAVENLSSKPVLLSDSQVAPNFDFYNENGGGMHPFYSDENFAQAGQSFRPTIYWIFLTFEELQNLKKIEFKPKE